MLPLVERDPYLAPHAPALEARQARYQAYLAGLGLGDGLRGSISTGYRHFGINRGTKDGVPGHWYREWAPGARFLSLIGDFNDWDRGAHPLTRDEFGVWQVFIPADSAAGRRLTHESRYKVHVATVKDALDRIPAYATRVVAEERSHFIPRLWEPPQPYRWQNDTPPLPEKGGMRIYETHVGMAQERQGIGTFDEFTANILPRIADLGYNAIQLMAIQEHPYYGSFGYHVSSFYGVSSRFGTPDELKRLIDTAHGRGIRVLLDLVHSHAVKNVLEGLNSFDGTDHQYFHAGPRGYHTAWDSLCFDYAKYEVQRFLLSNVRWWLEEYRFDGFRFDGVTSMLYLDHGLERDFTSYDAYFGENVDEDAIMYLQLATDLTHAIRPDAVCIAEDVSGMPGLARPVADGGIGFDYRLAMGVPDYWIKLIKEQPDEHWSLGQMYGTLLNRRHDEKHVGYVESHDQALVGDKTLAFQLMDAAMYTGMDNTSQSPVIDRGIALHKMIRLITFTLAGEAYLNFMGNEFGHPEWVDFPREGNNFSFQYCRRQWSLVNNPFLRYAGLNRFDKALQELDARYGTLSDPFIEQLMLHEDDRLLVYRRGPLVFAFNFHPTESYADLRIPVPDAADYRVILNTDETDFAGPGRSASGTRHVWQTEPLHGRAQSIQVYLPSRSAQVLAPEGVEQLV
jgi:1,4-alpha-glucan branching enzyme